MSVAQSYRNPVEGWLDTSPQPAKYILDDEVGATTSSLTMFRSTIDVAIVGVPTSLSYGFFGLDVNNEYRHGKR